MNKPYFQKCQKIGGVEHLLTDIQTKGQNTTITHYNILRQFELLTKAKPPKLHQKI